MHNIPLRGYGPRVFISYSFADKEVAGLLDQYLAERGCQIRREDESSLAGEKLTDILPQRIEDAEVLIQVLTTTANQSEWIFREFGYATDLRSSGHSLEILPVVLDRNSLRDEMKDWWYLDLSVSGLTDDALAEIERFCLRSLHLLPLSNDSPFEIDDAALMDVLSALASDSRRLLLDSDGKLLGWARDTLEYVDTLDDQPGREQFRHQEEERGKHLADWMTTVDEVFAKLCREALRVLDTYDPPARRALKCVTNFTRAFLGDLVVRAQQVAPPSPHPLRAQYGDLINEARLANSPGYSEGFRNPGLYAWAFRVKGGAKEVVKMGLDAQGFRGVPVVMPREVFGSMADAYTRTFASFDPNGELHSYVYADYVLPQIAIHAAYNLTDKATIRRDLDEIYAWRLDQYDRMGLE